MHDKVVNVVVAGLGGQGVLKASDILADAAFRAGYDVKKSEVHGMSQRGGSLSSDVRFGDAVRSPLIPTGEAHFLLILEPTQVEPNRFQLRDGGVLITPDHLDPASLANRRSLNVAMLGALSVYLAIPEAEWEEAIRAALPAKHHEVNLRAFAIGRAAETAFRQANPSAPVSLFPKRH